MSKIEKLNQPDSQLDEFDICCDLQVAMVFSGFSTPAFQCEEPARWAGFYSCCGKLTFVCDMHREDRNPFYCSKCKKHWDTLINWTKL
jgi:hypothetical protein